MLLYQKTLMKWNVNENNEWELTDEGPGIYQIQLNGESHWDYLEKLKYSG